MSEADKDWEELLSCLEGDFDEIAAHCKELRFRAADLIEQLKDQVSILPAEIDDLEDCLNKTPSDYQVSDD